MRLYGNLTNRIIENGLDAVPKVGDGATIFLWSDRHAATVVDVSPTGKTVYLTRDTARVVDGSAMDGSAKYTFTPNPNGPRVKVTKDKSGLWGVVGTRDGVRFGTKSEYRDPHF